MKNKKISNFIEDTRLYFKRKMHRKKKSFAKYTVVSACYNVSLYLDDFFRSMVKQTIGFIDNVFLIMVDDGSTDDTHLIIKKWANKFPNNITYIHKENGGQSTARNLGLKFVKTPWVTFTDPDDFLNNFYFENIDTYLRNCKERDNISLISTNIILFYEKDNMYKDNHPLAFKFKNEYLVLPVRQMEKNIQLSAASAVFNMKLLNKHCHQFTDIKPNFEDAYFIGDLLLKESNSTVVCLKKSKYFYRKRETGTSTLDNVWYDKRHFSDVFTKGYIPLLKKGILNKNSFGVIQNMVLYDILWHIIYLLNRDEATLFLSEDEKLNYLEYMDTCFSYIDKKCIFNFTGNRIWHYHKLGIMNCFKKEDPKISPLIYIEKYDQYKDEILIRFFVPTECKEEFRIDNKDIIPTHIKWIRDTFVGRTFILQRLVWLPLKNVTTGVLKVLLNSEISRISCDGVQKKEFPIDEIRECFSKTANDTSNGPWLFMDRMTSADDNAEHLYRYVAEFFPNKEIYYLLKKNSPDWKRLKKEGFNLVEFGCAKHKKLSQKCSKIISSHIDQFVTNYWKDNSLDNKQIVFLQHGVIKDDLSRWLNSKKRIDIFVTSTSDEYKSISGDFNRYRYTDKEVKLLGLTRYDALLKNVELFHKKTIMVMPTWRASLASNRFGKVCIADDFVESKYFKLWKNFLCSDQLSSLTRKYGYKVLFVPHPNIKGTLHLWNLPSYIILHKEANVGIQAKFKECSLLITDFSSVAFDVGFLGKPVLYYQFDEDTFWLQQVYQKGYFDYRRDGFGTVCKTQDELIIEMENLLKINCQNVPGLQERIDRTFRFRDGKNCERTFLTILNLDKPSPNQVNQDITISFIEKAIQHNDLELAKTRVEILISDYPDNQLYRNLLNLLKVNDLFLDFKISEIGCLLNSITVLPQQFINLKNILYAKFYVFSHQYDKAKKILEISRLNTCDYSMFVWVLRKLEIKDLPTKVMVNSSEIEDESFNFIVKDIYKKYLLAQFDYIISYFRVVTESDNEKLFMDSFVQVKHLSDNLSKLNDPFLNAMICEAAKSTGEHPIECKFRSLIEKLDEGNKLLKFFFA